MQLPSSKLKALLQKHQHIKWVELLRNEHTSVCPPANSPDEWLSAWFKQRVALISEILLTDRANSKNTSLQLETFPPPH